MKKSPAIASAIAFTLLLCTQMSLAEGDSKLKDGLATGAGVSYQVRKLRREMETSEELRLLTRLSLLGCVCDYFRGMKMHFDQ